MASVTTKRNEIQWLRAVAACEVLAVHSDLIVKHFSQSSVLESSWYRAFAGVGVELFFVISGYIMCMRVPLTKTCQAFLFARIQRIFPLYWLFSTVVVITATVVPAWHLGYHYDLATFARAYLVLPGWGFPMLGPGWTLEYEMVFYLLVTLLMAVGVRTGPWLGAFTWFLAGCGFIGCLVKPPAEGSALLHHILSPYMFAFGVGWLVRCIEPVSWPKRIGGVAPFAVLLAAGGLLSNGPPDGVLPRTVLAAVVFFAFLAFRPVFCANTAFNRALWLVGDASYSLYLTHWLVLSGAGKLLGAVRLPAETAWIVRLLGCSLCLVVAVATFSYVEKPLGRWLRWRTAPRPSSGAVVPGP